MDFSKTSLWEKLNNIIKIYIPSDQQKLIKQAFEVAYDAHSGQKRGSGEPYITHPVNVACKLAKLHLDHETIMAGLLHDVVEDTPVTKEQITEMFGNTISNLVAGVTKLDKLQFNDYKEAQVANIRKMVLAMVHDIRVILIKLADRTHNMQTLDGLRLDKRQRIAKETLEIYAPIANRLGMHQIKDTLEDLCFKNIYPMRYNVLKKSIDIAVENRQDAIETVAETFKENIRNKGIKCRVFYRPISIFNIYRKIRTKEIAFHSLLDNFCFTVIVDDVDLCYRTLGILHSIYKPKPGFFKDYIAVPKSNGYQSLHSALNGPHGMPIEVLIRTEFMDIMSEKGIAARWAVGQNDIDAKSAVQEQAQRWMNNLLELQANIGNAFDFVENVKDALFPSEIYVFTPNSIVELPVGSTAVDLAYAIGTDVGNSCSGVLVDHSPYPMGRELKSGQYVEIMRAPWARPNTSWLNYVTTARARTQIKQYLAQMKAEEAIILGKRLLNNALKNTTIEAIPKEKIKLLLEKTNHQTIESLYKDIALGDEMSVIAAQQFLGSNNIKSYNSAFGMPIKKYPVRGTSGLLLNFCEFCRPIPNDCIVGILTQKEGLVIHNSDCHCVKEEMAKELEKNSKTQVVNVDWDDNLGSQTFQTMIRVEFINDNNTISRITSEIGSETIITGMNTDRIDNTHLSMNIKINVRNTKQLNSIIKKVAGIPDVTRVNRVIDNKLISEGFS
jgi:guanosine-3',5'-bis(diphosphate) 3'-pyrophosphohydrolase